MFVLKSRSRGGAWFFAAIFLGLAVIFLVAGLGNYPKDLAYVPVAVLLMLVCGAAATTQVTCDADGLRSRMFRTVRVPASDITAINVESRLSQSSGRKNVLVVVERTSGKPIRLVATAMRDKPENRAKLEANANTIRELLGLHSSESESATGGDLRPV